MQWSRVVLAGMVAACSGDDLVLPGDRDPGSIEIVAGNGQTGPVGLSLADSLSIKVNDQEGRPISGLTLAYTLPSGGSITPGEIVTREDGIAAFRWALGTTAGAQRLEVGVRRGGTLEPRANFSAVATAGTPKRLVIVGGDGQSGEAGEALPESLVVRVEDQWGNPVVGAAVDWSPADGQVTPQQSTTGANGHAAGAWTLGGTAGQQSASAQIGSIQAEFSALATPPPPPLLQIVTQPSAQAVSGAEFARQPVIRLTDDDGVPIAQGGVLVTAAIASGGGTLLGITARATNASGVATFSDLAIAGHPGDRTLIFAANGHVSAVSQTIQVLAPPVSAVLSSVSASPGSLTAGGGSTTITVTARDAQGNPLPGLRVSISASGTGNMLVQPQAFTDGAGEAKGQLSSTKAEPKVIQAVVEGVDLQATDTVVVFPGAAHPAGTTADVPNGRVLSITAITIFSGDSMGNALTSGGLASRLVVRISGTHNGTIQARDNGNGTYFATYLPFFTGTDTVDITLDGVPIKGSPYTSVIQ